MSEFEKEHIDESDLGKVENTPVCELLQIFKFCATSDADLHLI